MRLRFQKRALQQIEDVLTYIAARSPRGAAKVEARIASLLVRVQQYPRSGTRLPVAGARRVAVTPYPYLIDYFVGEEEIVVQRFRHAARRPADFTPSRTRRPQ